MLAHNHQIQSLTMLRMNNKVTPNNPILRNSEISSMAGIKTPPCQE